MTNLTTTITPDEARTRVAELIQRSRELAPVAIAHAQACRELQQGLMEADWAWTDDGAMTADWESVNTEGMIAGLMAIAEPCGIVAEIREPEAAWIRSHGFPTLD